ncbi:glutamine synthetase [archaeon BMS3Bbin15]|nr:glutamine synthetase [archaeon BMS3Bbin15]
MSSLEEKKQKIFNIVEKKDVAFVKFQFTDVLGVLKSFAIPARELETAIDEGMGFDGSSILGYTPIHESDMIAMPDLDTFTLLPWRPQDKKVGRIVCDILTPEGRPFEGDPRYTLKRTVEDAKKMGYTMNVGPELEFFLFKSMESPEVTDLGGYFDLLPLDTAEDVRRQIIFALESMNIRVEYSHHEVAPSQHEIDLRYTDALTMADNALSYRMAVKAIASQNDLYGTFMPKPIFGENGSGMHTHQSLFTLDGKNAFFDADDKWYLSDTGKQYIAGCLKYAREITLVLAQWVNSYKRLVPGYEAPVYVSWARRNRSAMIRVPLYKPGKEKATRMEFRSPDPACNPYLAFAAMLSAGLAGIKEKLEIPDPIEENIFHMTEARQKELGIGSLPANLGEAMSEFENSELMRNTMGDHVFDSLLLLKKDEWDEYRVQVHDWELEKYYKLL